MLNYRALIHGVRAARFWDMGEDDRDFKWNNYISRYHSRHLDLMDVLAMYQGRGNAPLDQIAQLLGLPGKLGMDGSKVWDAYQAGRIEAIRHYCETDVANTYLVYQRFQLIRGAHRRGTVPARMRTGAHDAVQVHGSTLAGISGRLARVA